MPWFSNGVKARWISENGKNNNYDSVPPGYPALVFMEYDFIKKAQGRQDIQTDIQIPIWNLTRLAMTQLTPSYALP
jgi:hypothetical protein